MGKVDHDALEAALRRAGSSWGAAQAHGMMTGRLAVEGTAAERACLAQILEASDTANALAKEVEGMLAAVFDATYCELAGRQSEFSPMLPDDSATTTARTEALAHWSEGYLHGLVSKESSEGIRKQLAHEPVAGIIKDLLAMTRAAVDVDGDEEDEAAYAEVVEYLRVAVQLVYEELAGLRPTHNT